MPASSNPFSEGSREYAVARPTYPDGLFRWIAAQCERQERAWDCGTGSGQAAAALAPLFREVHATDISAEQIAQAPPIGNVRYSVQPAESTDLPPAAVDLIVVAQALHWFRFGEFWPEVRRVAREGALFCAFGYDWFRTNDVVERRLVTPFRSIAEPFWAKNNRILWDGYRSEDVDLPFEREQAPPFSIHLRWTADRLFHYMMTWSAYRRIQSDDVAARRVAALIESVRDLLASSEVFDVEMPLRTLVARVRATGEAGRASRRAGSGPRGQVETRPGA